MDNILREEFLNGYGEFPEHMNELGKFVYYRTYSRYLPEKGRRENWKETCRRSTEYNMSLAVEHYKKIGYDVPYEDMRKEAEAFFDNMFNLRQFLSGRTLWTGGADGAVSQKFPLANFNCSFINVKSYDDIADLFYLLLVGTGVGFKATKENTAKLKPIRNDVKIIHEDYTQRYPIVKEDDTSLFIINEGKKAVMHVGDSKEGWVEALRTFFNVLTDEKYEDVEEFGIYYDYIRPKGYRLYTFGGTASGYEPLKEMFEGFDKVIRGEMDKSLDPPVAVSENKVKLRPVHILDIGNLVGNNVVVGGVRRTAEIFLFDADDYESMFAKYGINGIWNEDQHKEVIKATKDAGLNEIGEWLETLPTFDPNARPLHHRRMSNNSVAFEKKPDRKLLNLIFTMMQGEGEPGFINLEEARRRRPNAEGLNPCAEILLDSYGVCNLTTVNMVQFVDSENKTLDIEGLKKAQRMSARVGLRMTLAKLELPHWDEVQQRDRLLGTSLTGVKDAMSSLDYTSEQEKEVLEILGNVAREEADKYAKELRVNAPLLVTTVKPEGTISQVANGVSSGLHYSHAPYYIRRIRINATDPLAKAVSDLGWTIHAEIGTDGRATQEELALPEVIEKARTLVIDFPIASGAKKTREDSDVTDQFDTYFRFQKHYTEHNSSNTVSVDAAKGEWSKAEEIVWNGWDDFVGVSFLGYDGGSYMLAPYEEITKEQYEEMSKGLAEFDPDILLKHETGGELDLEGADGCEGGGPCPIR